MDHSNQRGNVPFERALKDLRVVTLSSLDSDFARLVYLASTRNYNTGTYRHFGLAERYTSEVSSVALESSHEEIFGRILDLKLENLVGELDGYFRLTENDPAKVIDSWVAFEPYRMLPPRDCNAVAKRYFAENVKLALVILKNHPWSTWTSKR